MPVTGSMTEEMPGKGVLAASDSAGMAKMRQAAIAAGCLLMLAFIV
jgi:hypothetical protein